MAKVGNLISRLKLLDSSPDEPRGLVQLVQRDRRDVDRNVDQGTI